MDASRWPVRVERLLTIHTYFYESSKSLEGDRGRARVRQCRLLMSVQEGPHQKLFFDFPIKLTNWIIVDIFKYSYVITGNS